MHTIINISIVITVISLLSTVVKKRTNKHWRHLRGCGALCLWRHKTQVFRTVSWSDAAGTESVTCPRVWHVSSPSVNVFQKVSVESSVSREERFIPPLYRRSTSHPSIHRPTQEMQKSSMFICDGMHWCYNTKRVKNIHFKVILKGIRTGELCVQYQNFHFKKKLTYYATAVHMNIVWAIYLDT